MKSKKRILCLVLVLVLVAPILGMAAPEEGTPEPAAAAATAALVGIPGEPLTDAEILKLFVVDAPHADEFCTENAITLYEHGPDTAYGQVKTFVGTELYGQPGFEAVDENGYVVDPYFEKGGYQFVPAHKEKVNFYTIVMDFEDCVGDCHAPYGLQSSAYSSGGGIYDLTYPQVIFNMTFYALDGLAALPNHIYNGTAGTLANVPKGAKQRIEEISMGKTEVNPVCLNELYAQLHPDMDPVNDKWPWFRAQGPMLQYSTQGPADCEDYRQFARIHQEAIDSAVRAFEQLRADYPDLGPQIDEVLAGIEDIDHLYTVVPGTTHGYRSGLQGGSGLDTSFSYNDQALIQRDSEFRHIPGPVTPGGRNVGSAVFGVKGITRSPTNIIETFMHEYGHCMGLIDDYSYGSMGTNNGESTGSGVGSWSHMGGTMSTRSPDVPTWRKYRIGWIEDEEVKVILPGESWEGYLRAGSSYPGDGGTYIDDPSIKTRLVVIPKEYRSRDTFGVYWNNGWNPYKTAYNWYDWFTNPFLGGETYAIKSFPTFYALDSRKVLGVDSHMVATNSGTVVSYIANPTWETACGAGGFKIMSGAAGLRIGGTTTWQDQNIGLTITVLESGVFYDKIRVEYAPVPQRAAARHVYLGALTVSDSFAEVDKAFTVDFDIMTFGGPAVNDATASPAVPARVATPLGVQGGIAGFEMTVEFDAANLEYVSVGSAPFEYTVDAAQAAAGILKVTGAGGKSVDKDTILSLSFKAKAGAALGDYTIKGTITDVVLHNWRGEVIAVGDPGFNGTASGKAVGTIGNGGFGAFHAPNTLTLSSEDIKSTGGKVTIGPLPTFTVSGRIVCDTPGAIKGSFIGIESVVTVLNSAGVAVATGKSNNDGYYSIDGVAAGEGYRVSASKPKYQIGTSAAFAVTADTTAPSPAPMSRLMFTVSGTVYGCEGSEGFINSNSAANSTNIWAVNPQAKPLAGVDVFLINTGDAFMVVGGPVKTDEFGRYELTGWEIGRNFAAVAVSVKGTEYEDLYMTQIHMGHPAVHSPRAGIDTPLELIIGAKFGDNPADINYPSGVGAIGATRNSASGLFNVFCFSLDRNYTGVNVVLTQTQDVRIRMTTKSNQIYYQLRDMDDNAVGDPVRSLGNANGDDVIRDVAPGSYYIEASRSGYVSACTAPFTVDASRIIFRNNVTTNYMDLATTANGQTLSGTIVNSITGAPIEGARVQALPYSTAQGASVPVRTTGAGAFSVTTVNAARDINVSADGFATKNVYRAAGNASGLVIELVPVPRTIEAYVATEGETYCGDPIDYTVTLDKVKGVGTVSLNITVDTANQKIDLASAVTPLNGFTNLTLKWTDLGGGVWKGAVTMMYPGFATSASPLDILKITTVAGDKPGAASIAISDLEFTGDVGGMSGFLRTKVLADRATTAIVEKKPIYLKYDLNHDGAIDILDTNIAVYFYLTSSASAGWATEPFGVNEPATAQDADVNGSGRVDLADLIEIMANYRDSYDLFPY